MFKEYFTEATRMTTKELNDKFGIPNVNDRDYNYIAIDMDGENLEMTLNGINDFDWNVIEDNRCCNFRRYPKENLVAFDKKKDFVKFAIMMASYNANITQGMIKDTGIRFTKREISAFRK